MLRAARSIRTTALTLSTALVLGVTWGSPRASGTAQVDGGGVTLHLVSQPASHTKSSDLDLRLRITNASSVPLEGFKLQVSAFDRITSRTALHESFEGPASLSIGLEPPMDFPGVRISPHHSIERVVGGPLTDLFSPDQGGVYPITISLYDLHDVDPLDSLTTELLYYPDRVETKLNLVLVVALGDLPQQGPDGTFTFSGTDSLARGMAPDGWLSGMADALAANALKRRGRVRMAVAPTPRLLDEIASMADGFVVREAGGVRRVAQSDVLARRAGGILRRLGDVLKTRDVQTLLVPYATPDLPELVSHLSSGQPEPLSDPVRSQIEQGLEVLKRVFGSSWQRYLDPTWLFPPGGRLDAASLDRLQGPPTGYKVFFSPDSLVEPDPGTAGCPRPFATFSCPVVVRALHGQTRGFVADRGVQERLAALSRPGDTGLDLQRFLAETAMIREELPGVAGRVVQATVPPLWHPKSHAIRSLLRAVGRAPWLRTLTPSQGLLVGSPRATRRIRQSVSSTVVAGPQPGADLYATIEKGTDAVAAFFSTLPPTVPDNEVALSQRLLRDILVAQSRLWWAAGDLTFEARRYADDVGLEVQHQLQGIRIGGRRDITVTSRQQPLPLVLFNRNDYPMRVSVNVSSSGQVDFNGNTEITRQITLPPGNQPFDVQATVRSSGTFPLTVTVTTPDGHDILAEEIVVRSTEFNKIALGITIGALVFLILFYLLRAIRRERQGSSPSEASTG